MLIFHVSAIYSPRAFWHRLAVVLATHSPWTSSVQFDPRIGKAVQAMYNREILHISHMPHPMNQIKAPSCADSSQLPAENRDSLEISTKSTDSSELSAKSADSSRLSVESADSRQLSAKSANSSRLSVESADSRQLSAKSANSSQLSVESADSRQLSAKSADSSQLSAKSTYVSKLSEKSRDLSQLTAKLPIPAAAASNAPVSVDGDVMSFLGADGLHTLANVPHVIDVHRNAIGTRANQEFFKVPLSTLPALPSPHSEGQWGHNILLSVLKQQESLAEDWPNMTDSASPTLPPITTAPCADSVPAL
jgi:hypothetical protein